MTDIKLEILQNGPVSAGMMVYDDLFNYDGSYVYGPSAFTFRSTMSFCHSGAIDNTSWRSCDSNCWMGPSEIRNNQRPLLDRRQQASRSSADRY